MTLPTLLEVQRAVYRSLVACDDAPAAAHIARDGLAPEARLNIYRNTFIATLTTALRLSYPAVHRLVGAEFFEGVAGMFVQRHPPECAYLDLYGAGFREFLKGLDAVKPLPYLPDVAGLEWAVARALHAPDAKPLALARLADIPLPDHGSVRFVPHPSISLIHVAYPADTIWRGVLSQDDAALAKVDLNQGAAWLLVERLDSNLEVTRIDEPAWRFLAALCASRPLGDAIEAAGSIDAGTALAEHLASGRFVSFALASQVGAMHLLEAAR